MNVLRFKKMVSSLVMLTFTTLSTIVPFAQAQAAAICNTSDYATNAGSNGACTTVRFPTGSYAFPKVDWQPMGTLSATPDSGISLSTGTRILSDNNRTAAALGLNSKDTASVLSLFPENVPFVFARFNPAAAELRIDLFKVVKLGTAKTMQHALFAPEHGRAWAASLAYASDAEKQLRLGPGRSPFTAFEGGDDAFHNITGLNAVQVAVGHAMRATSASIGLVSVADVRIDQYTTSHGFFRKTTTQHVDGYTKPQWFIATPKAFQPDAMSLPLCLDNVANAASCPSTSVVQSGVSWAMWEGGSLPAFETLTSQWTHSQSGFTLIFFVAIAFLAFFTAGAALGPLLGTTAVGPTASIVEGVTTAANTVGAATLGEVGLVPAIDTGMAAAAQSAAMEAAMVGTVGMAQGASLTTVLTGTSFGATSGVGSARVAVSEMEASVLDGIHAQFDTPSLTATGVTAVSQAAYGVACDPSKASTECADSGLVPRKDMEAQSNTAKVWQDNGTPLPMDNSFLH